MKIHYIWLPFGYGFFIWYKKEGGHKLEYRYGETGGSGDLIIPLYKRTLIMWVEKV